MPATINDPDPDVLHDLLAADDEPEPEHLFDCESCGDPVTDADLREHAGRDDATIADYSEQYGGSYCPSCHDGAATYWCEVCGEEHVDAETWPASSTTPQLRAILGLNRWAQVLREYTVYTDEATYTVCAGPTCENCGYEIDVSWQDTIDNWVINEDWYCSDCRRSHRSAVNNWDHRPTLWFRWLGKDGSENLNTFPQPGMPYLGMEIETENCANADAVQDLFPADLVYLKEDGSLSDDGVEIVTHPATFEWFMAKFPWDALNRIVKQGVESWDHESTGIHVHVSADAFTAAHLFKFLAFHYRNPQVCQVVGQRGSVHYGSWSEWLATRPSIVKYALKKDRPHTRYMAVNLTETDTVELRYFKGNLNPARVRKNLQWVDAVYRYTRTVPGIDSDQALRFDRMIPWLLGQEDRYPDLIPFLRERGLVKDGKAATPGRDD